MKPTDYKYTGKHPLAIDKAEHGAKGTAHTMKDELIQRTEENLEHITRLQERLYADAREGLIVVLQGLDASGKDSVVRHVMSCLNPQGVTVHSFKAPTADELAHDFLWRIAARVPARGQIAIFNRSHYEDVVAVDVLKLYPHFRLPERCLDGDFIGRRLEQIRAFEEYLYDNGVRMLKIFLNVSLDEQKKRMLERLDDPDKNWKFNGADLGTRAQADAYRKAYERAINETATKHAPWHVLPADNKWFTRYLVSEALLESLKKINPRYPQPSAQEAALFPQYRAQLQER